MDESELHGRVEVHNPYTILVDRLEKDSYISGPSPE
jgi:hypothetical protein